MKAIYEFLVKAYSYCNLSLQADGARTMTAEELKLFAAVNARYVLEGLRMGEGIKEIRSAFYVYCGKLENKRRMPTGAEIVALIEEARPAKARIVDPGPKDMAAAEFGAYLVKRFKQRVPLDVALREYKKEEK